MVSMVYIKTSLLQHFFIPANGTTLISSEFHKFLLRTVIFLLTFPIPSHISPQKRQELKSIQKLLKYKFHKISKQSPTEI